MKPEEQIKALAELDGVALAKKQVGNSVGYRFECEGVPLAGGGGQYGWGWCSTPEAAAIGLPQYLTSYDAIIPLIQGQAESFKVSAWDYLRYAVSKHYCPFDYTPAQLCEALLRATVKWKE